MPSYEHSKLLERITQLSQIPDCQVDYEAWINADAHLRLLQGNAQEQELIVYADNLPFLVRCLVVKEDDISSIEDKSSLLRWGMPLGFSCAYYAHGTIERPWECSNSLKNVDYVRQLVYCRPFKGLTNDRNAYIEISQEYSHLAEIHWLPEHHAYCCLDMNGDFDHVISITFDESVDPNIVSPNKKKLDLVSFRRKQLDQYLRASNSVLVQMFRIDLFQPENFSGWNGKEKIIFKNDELFYNKLVSVDQDSGYIQGVQIIRPSSVHNKKNEEHHVEFIALDWRNRCTAEISTDPSATTNYFQSQANSLPYEISPAFFRPEILARFKSDREKYTLNEMNRTIKRRGNSLLRSFDINDAGQVSAYIRDLRNLPYQEKLYWKSFNEEPKAGLSQQSIENDFDGMWSQAMTPLDRVWLIVKEWALSDVQWWKLRDESLLEQVNTPLTSSDEWARAFADLQKLIVERFELKTIRVRLDELDIDYSSDNQRSLALIEILVRQTNEEPDYQLKGLKDVQKIRSKVASHVRGRDAKNLKDEALKEHGTYKAHFNSVCQTVAQEL